MILKAIKIVPYLIASVNPSNFYTNNKLNATTQPTDFNYSFAMSYVSNLDTPNVYDEYTSRRYKYSGQLQRNEFLINQYAYANTYSSQLSSNLYESIIYKAFTQYSNSYLVVFQITPYQPTINNEITLGFKVRLNSIYDSDLDTYNLITETYTSTDTYWGKYVDYNILDPYLNYDAITDITDSTQGFNFTKRTKTQEITENEVNNVYKNIEQEIYIDPNKTNYVYMLTYMTFESSSDATGTTFSLQGSSCIYNDGQNTLTTITGSTIAQVTGYEVVNIPGLMFDVLTLPFTFISVAFNLTLFPNTPYQVNISNLFLSILGIMIFIFLIRLLLKNR